MTNIFKGIKFFADGTLYQALLRKHFFIIPDYQRDYSWQKKNIEELLIDLDVSCKERKSHFVGAIVLSGTKDDENIQIIDGQQRLISISLITSCISKIALGLTCVDEFLERKNDLISACTFNLSREIRGKRKNLIELLRTSDLYYSNLINHKANVTENTREEEKLFDKNCKIISTHLLKNIDKFKDISLKLEYLEDMLSVIENISIIPIYVNNEYDAYTIFEVLNDRGLELNIADLLKNLIFKKTSTENKDKIKIIWEEMLVILENSKINVTQFIRHYWISKEAPVREKELYERIKDKIKGYNDQNLIDFLSDLLNNAKSYKKVYLPVLDDFRGVDKGKSIFLVLNYLDTLNVKQCYPIVLTLYGKFLKAEINGDDLVEYLSLIEKFSFIYIKTDLSPSKIEGLYSEYSIKIFSANKGEIRDIFNKLIFALKSELNVIDLRKIYDNLVYEKDGNNKLINYVLQRLELKDNIEFNVDGNAIEHIFSKSGDSISKYSTSNSSSIEEAIYDINKIGNLTLLTGEDNEELDNEDDFNKKVSIYGKSRIGLTKELSSFSKWNKNEINARHDTLFKIFSGIWKI